MMATLPRTILALVLFQMISASVQCGMRGMGAMRARRGRGVQRSGPQTVGRAAPNQLEGLIKNIAQAVVAAQNPNAEPQVSSGQQPPNANQPAPSTSTPSPAQPVAAAAASNERPRYEYPQQVAHRPQQPHYPMQQAAYYPPPQQSHPPVASPFEELDEDILEEILRRRRERNASRNQHLPVPRYEPPPPARATDTDGEFYLDEANALRHSTGASSAAAASSPSPSNQYRAMRPPQAAYYRRD